MMEEARLLASSTALSSVGFETRATCGHRSQDKASAFLITSVQYSLREFLSLESDYFELINAKASREETTFTFSTN